MKPEHPPLRHPGTRPSWTRPGLSTLRGLAGGLWMLATACSAASPRAEDPIDVTPFAEQARALALQGTAKLQGLRVEVETGRLDPRLKLAPCARIEPYLPPGFKAWGATRVGLRCLEGPTRWNVYLPVTVRVFGPALVAAIVLPAGSVLAETDLRVEEVDLAAQVQPAVADVMAAVGRPLTVALKPGESLRQHHLRARQWFAAGETVKLIARGPGFAVEGEGLAMAPGLEGQTVRVRTESGRIVSGLPAGERRVELSL
jgi:flagella basal body P-ring formation protein FlgA